MALKQLHGGDCVVSQLLLQEVEILQRASFDPNVVQFYGTCMNFSIGPLLVMEFLEVRTWNIVC